jgi:DNA-binding NtrC family response regulator
MDKRRILVAEEDDRLRRTLAELLGSREFTVIESSTLEALHKALTNGGLAVAILGSLGEKADVVEIVQMIRQADRRLPLILIPPRSSEELVIRALKLGVADYFKRPFSDEELIIAVNRCLLSTESSSKKEVFASELIGESWQMSEIRSYSLKVASTDSNVMITGETGTGKELLAEFLHGHSPRRNKPLVCINCAAIPDTLLESELFGYERGAFTGAHAVKEGKLKLADGGTVLFDEVGDMDLYGQAKILRAIERKEVERLGGRRSIPIDIRILAATNRDLDQLVAEGKFRQDLYYRLQVATVHLPPLRMRKEDIPLLIGHFLVYLNRRFKQDVEGLTDEALEYLLRYDWPGNVRELKNLLEAAFFNLSSRKISLNDLPERFRRRMSEIEGISQDERNRLVSALFSTNWNKSKAAQKLHWSRMTVYRKMAKYRLTSDSKTQKNLTAEAPGRRAEK